MKKLTGILILSFVLTLSFAGVTAAQYNVQKSDTLYGVAWKYKMGYQDLRSLNPQIRYPNQINIGQSIVVRTSDKVKSLN